MKSCKDRILESLCEWEKNHPVKEPLVLVVSHNFLYWLMDDLDWFQLVTTEDMILFGMRVVLDRKATIDFVIESEDAYHKRNERNAVMRGWCDRMGIEL